MLFRSLVRLSNDTINLITKIAQSINNEDIRALTENLNDLMVANQEAAQDESTTDSEVDQDESEDLS